MRIVQGGQNDSQQKFDYVHELYESSKRELVNTTEKIQFLEAEVRRLRKLTYNVDFANLSAEAKVLYDGVEEFGFSNEIRTDFSKMDTVPAFTVKWKESAPKAQRDKEYQKLKGWLELKTSNDKVEVKELN